MEKCAAYFCATGAIYGVRFSGRLVRTEFNLSILGFV